MGKNHFYRNTHIHVLFYGSAHWIRHVAFRDYLKAHPSVKNAYQDLKMELSKAVYKDGNEYNFAKDFFMKSEEEKVVKWYTTFY